MNLRDVSNLRIVEVTGNPDDPLKYLLKSSGGFGTGMLAGISKDYFDAMMARMPMGRLGQAQEVAALIAWLASEDCSFSTGAVYDITGGRAVY